jgi:hypothetical protein
VVTFHRQVSNCTNFRANTKGLLFGNGNDMSEEAVEAHKLIGRVKPSDRGILKAIAKAHGWGHSPSALPPFGR